MQGRPCAPLIMANENFTGAHTRARLLDGTVASPRLAPVFPRQHVRETPHSEVTTSLQASEQDAAGPAATAAPVSTATAAAAAVHSPTVADEERKPRVYCQWISNSKDGKNQSAKERYRPSRREDDVHGSNLKPVSKERKAVGNVSTCRREGGLRQSLQPLDSPTELEHLHAEQRYGSESLTVHPMHSQRLAAAGVALATMDDVAGNMRYGDGRHTKKCKLTDGSVNSAVPPAPPLPHPAFPSAANSGDIEGAGNTNGNQVLAFSGFFLYPCLAPAGAQ